MFEKAYDEAKKTFEEKEKEQVKKMVTELLTKREKLSKEKEEIEEKIRIIGKELEDLKNGKIDKIKERHEKSDVAEQLMPFRFIGDWGNIPNYFPGTYDVTCNFNGQEFRKIFYF